MQATTGIPHPAQKSSRADAPYGVLFSLFGGDATYPATLRQVYIDTIKLAADSYGYVVSRDLMNVGRRMDFREFADAIAASAPKDDSGDPRTAAVIKTLRMVQDGIDDGIEAGVFGPVL